MKLFSALTTMVLLRFHAFTFFVSSHNFVFFCHYMIIQFYYIFWSCVAATTIGISLFSFVHIYRAMTKVVIQYSYKLCAVFHESNNWNWISRCAMRTNISLLSNNIKSRLRFARSLLAVNRSDGESKEPGNRNWKMRSGWVSKNGIGIELCTVCVALQSVTATWFDE